MNFLSMASRVSASSLVHSGVIFVCFQLKTVACARYLVSKGLYSHLLMKTHTNLLSQSNRLLLLAQSDKLVEMRTNH
jgi:hypothetical protein